MTRFLALCLLLVPLAACGGDDDGEGGDGDADADADTDADADADADGDVDLCALSAEAGTIELAVLVDRYEVRTCGGSDGDRWRLNVWACGEAADAACADRTGGPCSGEGERLLLGDACGQDTFTMPTAGHYTLCVEAELVNGFVAYEQCADIDLGPDGLAEAVPYDLDAEGVFPCVRGMQYYPDDNQCCDRDVGACFPPSF
jgi:hypothetical protein